MRGIRRLDVFFIIFLFLRGSYCGGTWLELQHTFLSVFLRIWSLSCRWSYSRHVFVHNFSFRGLFDVGNPIFVENQIFFCQKRTVFRRKTILFQQIFFKGEGTGVGQTFLARPYGSAPAILARNRANYDDSIGACYIFRGPPRSERPSRAFH